MTTDPTAVPLITASLIATAVEGKDLQPGDIYVAGQLGPHATKLELDDVGLTVYIRSNAPFPEDHWLQKAWRIDILQEVHQP